MVGILAMMQTLDSLDLVGSQELSRYFLPLFPLDSLELSWYEQENVSLVVRQSLVNSLACLTLHLVLGAVHEGKQEGHYSQMNHWLV